MNVNALLALAASEVANLGYVTDDTRARMQEVGISSVHFEQLLAARNTNHGEI